MKKTMIALGLLGFILIGYGAINEFKAVKHQREIVQKEAEELEAQKQKEEEEAKLKEEAEKQVAEEESAKEAKETEEEMAEESAKRETIVIDPGHAVVPSPGTEAIAPSSTKQKAKDAVGAMGVSSKVNEYKLTHDLAPLLKDDLEKRGFNVVMTKTKIEEQLSNIERAEVGNKNNASLLIRLHADSFSNASATGASMLVPSKALKDTAPIADASRKYGQTILDSYISKVPIKSRGVIERDDMTGFNWSKVPVIIIELGFLSNPTEDSYLTNPNNYGTMVQGIGEGIDKCFPKE